MAGGIELGGFNPFDACGLEAGHEDLGHAFEQFVAEIMIAVAFLAQAAAVEKNRLCWFVGHGVEVPVIRWEKPGPAQDVTRADGLDSQRGAGAESFQADRPANDEVKTVGRFAGFHDDFARGESGLHRTVGQNLAVGPAQPAEKRVIGQ